jgi:putative heme-binding domain-containing protein
LLEQAATTASQTDGDVKARADAIALLRLGTFPDRRELFASLLKPVEPAEIQAATLATLSALAHDGVAGVILQAWPTFSPRLRSIAADVLASRASWLTQLLQAIHRGTIPTGDLDSARWQVFAAHSQPSIRELAREIASSNRPSSRSEILAQYREVLDMPGDAGRGQEVFRRICAACHQAGGVGHPIGPNLATTRNRGPDAILANVLAPNQEVNPQYVNYIVLTRDGRQLTGMISAETATSVTLTRAENQSDTVLRIDIEELRATGASLMPEGFESQIDKQAMADLLEYVKNLE